jgi:predicted ATPase
MLTRLRIQGFRNLLDVDLRLGPFTCLSGRNGSGKSGIFDTIRFLYLLSNRPIMEAAEAVRGDGSGGCDPTHLFATYGDWRAREIRFTAEMIVDQQVEDDFGVVSEASTTALQYIIGLRLVSGRVGPQLVISEEQLLPLGVKATRRGLGFPSKPIFRRVISGRRAAPFISTERDGDAGPAIQVHHEGHSSRRFPARRASRTALSGLADSEFPTILAVHREMERWRLLAVEPTALRQASGYRDPEKLGNRGEHLASTLARLERSDPNPGATLGAMAESMRLLGEDVKELRVIDDRARQTRSVEVQGRDGIFRPTWALSDATLRAMAICAGLTEARAGGLIGLEEPENGLHPERVPALVALLRASAVDTERGVGAENPLRQVLLSTHSPRLVRDLAPDELVFVDPMEVERGGVISRIGVLRAPAGSWREERKNGHHFLDAEPAPLIPPPSDRRGQITLPFTDPAEL